MSPSTYTSQYLSLLRLEPVTSSDRSCMWSPRQRPEQAPACAPRYISSSSLKSQSKSALNKSKSASSSTSKGAAGSASGSPAASPTTTRAGVRPHDILCGRDKTAHNHPGNKRFRTIVQSKREQYQSAGRRDDKNRIINEIIAQVYREGGRFLRNDEDTGEWVLVEPSGVHDKVSHALRSAKEPRRTPGEMAGEAGGSQSKFVQLASMQQLFFMNLLQSDEGGD